MSYEPSPCLIPDCDGYGHPDLCTRYLAKTLIGGELEVSTELVVGEGGRHISVFGIRGQFDEALNVRATTREQLLALAAQFADVAKMIERAVDELPEDEPTEDVCATCEQVWPVEDLGRDGNGDVQCVDCASTDTGAEDTAACRSYMFAGR